MTTIDTPEGINFFHLLSQRGALRLEIMGMRRSSGRSVYSIVKDEHGFKGTKQQVLDQLNEKIEEAKR
jgi:hypothetical protein